MLTRISAHADTFDADVDQVDIGEEDHLDNSDNDIIESDDGDDAGIFNIANDCSSEDDDTIADEQKATKTLSAVLTKRTG